MLDDEDNAIQDILGELQKTWHNLQVTSKVEKTMYISTFLPGSYMHRDWPGVQIFWAVRDAVSSYCLIPLVRHPVSLLLSTVQSASAEPALVKLDYINLLEAMQATYLPCEISLDEGYDK